MTLPMVAFKVFAPKLVASRDAAGRPRIEGIASSTVRDHHGDQITLKALKKMADSSIGMTIFMNHEYRVPEDVFGTVEKAAIVPGSGVDKAGNKIYDLRLGIGVAQTNPKAMQTFDLIDADEVKLGLSIGAMLPEGGYTLDKTDGGRLIIDDIELVETSMVSIPANPRAFVDYAVKSITGLFPSSKPKVVAARKSWFDKMAEDSGAVPPEALEDLDEDEDNEEVVVDEPAEIATKSTTTDVLGEAMEHHVEAADLTDETAPHDEAGEPLELDLDHPDLEKGKKTHQHPHAHAHEHEHEHGYGDTATVHSHEHAHQHSHDHAPDHEHLDDQNDYSHNHPHNGSYDNEDHAHGEGAVKAEPAPEITKAHKVTVWEEPDGSRVTEVHVGRSKPKPDDGDQSVQDSLSPETTGGQSTDGSGGSTSLVLSLDTSILDAELLEVVRKANDDTGKLVKHLLAQVKASRLEVVTFKEREVVLLGLLKGLSDGTRDILDRVGRLPVGRKAVEFPQIREDFEDLDQIYAADVRKLMTKGR